MESVKCSQCGVETETGCAHAKCPYGELWKSLVPEPVVEEVDEGKPKKKK
jgi:hypothetical protein